MEDPHVTWLKITDTSTDTIAAAAKWIIWPPGQTPSPSQLQAETLGTGEGEGKRWPDKVDVTWVLPSEKGLNVGAGSDDQEYVEWIMEEFFGRRRERVKGPAVLLDMLFCAPTHHRRGAGKQLVEWGTKRADELGVTAFVEASFMGWRLYESCGFVVTEDVCLEGGKVKKEWKEYGLVEYKFMVKEKKEKS
jgi:GNAT superfamily N-acetyltransferase